MQTWDEPSWSVDPCATSCANPSCIRARSSGNILGRFAVRSVRSTRKCMLPFAAISSWTLNSYMVCFGLNNYSFSTRQWNHETCITPGVEHTSLATAWRESWVSGASRISLIWMSDDTITRSFPWVCTTYGAFLFCERISPLGYKSEIGQLTIV